MRTITHTETIAKYSELTEDQKLKVLENYNDINTDNDWYHFIYDDVKTQLKLLGFEDIEIEFSGFSSQGDGASFTGKFTVPQDFKEIVNRLAKFKEEFPTEKTFNFEHMFFTDDEKECEVLEVYSISSRYSHSNTITSDSSDLKEFARSFSDAIYRRLESEYYYLQSREAIEETIEANDYEFSTTTFKIA